MLELAFLTSPGQNWFFHDLVATLRQELDVLGVPSTQSDDGFPKPHRDRVYVITPPHEYFALEGPDALGDDPKVLGRTIFICAEQPTSVHFDSNVELSRRAGAVFDISTHSVRQLRQRGVLAEHLQVGYTRRWDHYDPECERDIDVLFMGCRTRRRSRFLASYGRVLSRRACHFHLSDNSVPNTGSSPSFLAEEKWSLLARSKLVLNLHQADEPYFEWLRAMDAIHSGCVLLSEHSTGYSPLEPGRHFFSASPESLGLLADRLASDEQRLAATARDAHELIRERAPLSRSVSRIVDVASRLATGPVPARPPARSHARPVIRRLDSPLNATLDPDASILRRALKDTRLDVLELRRDLKRIDARLSAPASAPPPRVRVVASSAAWQGSSGERVTVVTALYNHAQEVVDALDSVSRSRYRDFEIVVVDDGSADGSGEVVKDWIRGHDGIAAMLAEHPVNRGLGAARNTAIDFARGEFCFVLDADNEVYSRCIEALVARLDADPSVAFSYPMLEVFHHVDAHVAGGADYFVSALAWDPQWLRSQNFIDAFALIRTATLRELGGYALDRRLHGIEDWDLWCRIADRGGSGGHVPQVLGRYRASPSSMVSLSGVSLTSAVAALVERSPTLMAGVLPPM